MLVLSRLVSERVFLHLPDGREIAIMLTGVKKGTTTSAQFGIDAPPDIVIRREEVPYCPPRLRQPVNAA